MFRVFGLLMIVQAAHSIEEYAGRLWESFPPAAFVSGLISSNHEKGFIIFNVALILFGLWCWWWPVRRHWPSSRAIIWGWVAVDVINGIGHPLWSLIQGLRYTPGVATAPLLLLVAMRLTVLQADAASPRPRTAGSV